MIAEVPWGNLWRTGVTTMLFTLILGVPIALLTRVDSGTTAVLFQQLLVLVSFVLASLVVWSETVPWIGDS